MYALVKFEQKQLIDAELARQFRVPSVAIEAFSGKIGKTRNDADSNTWIIYENYYHYLDDLTETDGEYFTSTGEKVDKYYIVRQRPNDAQLKNLVIAQTATFIVDLVSFAAVCDRPFTVVNCISTSGLEAKIDKILTLLESK